MTTPITLQTPGAGEQMQKALAPLLEMLQAQQQRQMQQQQMYMQYGQLTLAKEKFAEEQKQRNEQKKQLEQAGEALVQQIQGLSAPQGMEQHIRSTYETGDPTTIAQMNRTVEALKVAQAEQQRGQAIAGIRQKYAQAAAQKGGVPDIVDMYNESRELAAADPTNQVFQQAVSNAELEMSRPPNYDYMVNDKGEITGFKRSGMWGRGALVLRTGEKALPTGSAARGSSQMLDRILPRVGALNAAMNGLERMENDARYARGINQVASALATGKLPLHIGSTIEAFKGLGFSPEAKEYATQFYAAVDHLMAMQPNLRAIVQVDFWKQLVVPFMNEVYQPVPLKARQRMRQEMLAGYVDYLSAKMPRDQFLAVAKAHNLNVPTEIVDAPDYQSDNPFAPKRQP